MLEGVKIICERIRVFPEEVPKWKHFLNTQVTEMLTDEEHESIKEALRDHFRRDFNARVLDMINDSGVKADPRIPRFGKAQIKAEGQPVTY
jgi:hypothetical protein